MSVSGRAVGGRLSPGAFGAGAIALCVVIGLVWLGTLGRTSSLSGSAVGFDGLAVWLRSEGVPARTYEGWSAIDANAVGLRVLPLFDADLGRPRRQPRDTETLLAQESEVDISLSAVRQKIARIPTLVVLPKWRTGMRLGRAAHPDFRVAEHRLPALVAALTRVRGAVQRSDDGFVSFPVPALSSNRSVSLYAPQTAAAGPCEPLIGTAEAMVLGRCEAPLWASDGSPVSFHLLVDPDLMNNHGLSIGENAAVTARLIKTMSGGRPVIIDYTTTPLTDERTAGERREREWSDLARFFGAPFQPIWIGLLGLLALLLWRGSVRYGAALSARQDPKASKAAAIDAKARLLRLAGHDAAVVAAYVDMRLCRLAAALVGPRPWSPRSAYNALMLRLQRRNETLADALADTVVNVRSLDRTASLSDVVQGLDRFEDVAEKVRHDFGRTRPSA